jgi:hypothetical protein
MTNAALAGAALPTTNDTVDGTNIVTSPAARPAREIHIDHASDWVAHRIATKFAVSPSVANLIAHLSGLRGSADSRWSKAA